MGEAPSADLDRAPLKRYHWVLTTLGAMGVMMDGYDLSVIGFSVLLLSSDFHLSPTSGLYGLVLASGLIGMAMGGVTFGWLADRVGRKTMFVADMVLFVVFAVLSGLAQNVWQVIIFRVLMGVGIGGDYPVSSSLISEFAPAKKRGFLLMYGIMFYWLGTLLAGVVNYLSLPLGTDLAWRVPLMFGGLLALPVVLVRNYASESPRWLLQKKRFEEARAVASGRLELGLGERMVGGQPVHPARELFSRYFRSTFYVLASWFAFDVGAYGFGFYVPTLYRQLGISSLQLIAGFSIISSPFPIMAYLFLMYTVDRYGRRLFTMLGFAAMIAVLLVLPPLAEGNPYLLLPLWIVYSSLEQWPGGILSFGYSVELFPTSLRAFAQGLATTVSRVGGIVGILALPYIARTYGLWYGTLFFVAFLAFALVATALIAPETRGATLEDLGEGKAPP
ncbi:MAG: MFS transporter [Nitrososphaerota archaeon]|nr:MFS transporter [Nitrososphaerota archaeon]MDG6940131.1 MFS transporter [Nitrososphaerota archaeon]